MKTLLLKKSSHYKYLCLNCLKTGKGSSFSCGVTGHKIIGVPHIIHFPKITASKSKWVKFIEDSNLLAFGCLRDKSDRDTLLKTISNLK